MSTGNADTAKGHVQKSGKGAKREIEVAVALWIDLLGYGSMLEKAGWDPTSPIAAAARARIERFQSIVSRFSTRKFPSFVMNDGAIFFRDLSPRSRAVTFDFIRRSVELHRAVNESDRAAEGPGCRAVLATGFRIRRFIDFSSRLNDGRGQLIKKKVESGFIEPAQAINEALMARHDSDSTPELQHNYAMTKAYLAESGGTKKGFAGPNIFVDAHLFVDGTPAWLKVDETFDWTERGMTGRFHRVDGSVAIPMAADTGGVRDAFEIASVLSPNPGVLDTIRASKLGDLRKPATAAPLPKPRGGAPGS